MEIIGLFCVICFTTLRTAQGLDEYDTPAPAATALPMSSINPTVRLDPPAGHVYTTETVRLQCLAGGGSPDWTYQWFLPDQSSPLASWSDRQHTIDSAGLADAGQYRCRIKRGEDLSMFSSAASLSVTELPTPRLRLRTRWQDVFPSESVELGCELPGAVDWTFTWYRDEQPVTPDDRSVSPTAEGPVLNISRATAAHGGRYACEAQLKARRTRPQRSDVTTITVHGNRPKPTLQKNPGVEQLYVGESVSLSCQVSVSSGWEYRWYKDGGQLPTAESSTLTISSPAASDGGNYTCMATRGANRFLTEESNALSLNVIEIPVPRAEVQTPWSDVFPNETVRLNCSVQRSPDSWTYTWSRGGQEVDVQEPVSVWSDGASLRISSASPEHAGQYSCTVQHKDRPVKSKPSDTLWLKVYDHRPRPTLTMNPGVEQLYVGESVSLSCQVSVSSGWEYRWYKDGGQLPTADSSTLTISSPAASDGGKYTCMATRGANRFPTEKSHALSLNVINVPTPTIKLNTPWPDVFPTERVELSCRVEGSSGWRYTWYRGGDVIPNAGDGATLSIPGVSAVHAGQYACRGQKRTVSSKNSTRFALKVYDTIPTPELRQDPGYEKIYVQESLNFTCKVSTSTGWEYLWFQDQAELPSPRETYPIPSASWDNAGAHRCRATRGRRTFSTNDSKTLTIHVEARPWATVTLLTGWSEVFSTDRLDLKCEVHGSPDPWNYTWTRGDTELQMPSQEKLTVTPSEDPDDSEYICKGVRSSRPLYSKPSGPFKTTNLLLKRRVLLSISGFLFFGIIAVFLGCIVLRLTRKPVKTEDKPEEHNLFLTMAELKACDVAPCPLAEYVAEEGLAALTTDGEDEDTVCSESTPLPLGFPESQAETSENTADHGGLKSFSR